MNRKITIKPITRLEGHGQIDIFLDSQGGVERVHLRIPEFRGFEKFCEGRAAEEMPTLTQKICGVCPTAHHTASVKALDALYGADPPPAARKIRDLVYNAFIFEDHLLHFYFLGGPDFIVATGQPRSRRNILGVLDRVGIETGKKVIDMRNRVRNLHAGITGSPLYPVFGLAGGVSKPLTEEDRAGIQPVAADAVEFAGFTLELFHDVVLKNTLYTDLLASDVYRHQTYYMGLVDDLNRVSFYDGKIRVVDPGGREFVKFEAGDYLEHLEERIEPLTYLKTVYLKGVGWNGYLDGQASGIYRVGPLARLNVSEGMATPLAQAEREKMFDALGGKPVHNTLAYHWARLIEVMNAAERMVELANDEEITSTEVRNLPVKSPEVGIGVCEAPRGTLLHHYRTDPAGLIKKLNLLVATQNSGAAIHLSIEKAARHFIKGGRVSDDILNMVEMAFRAYDPCMACATHFLPGRPPTLITLYDHKKDIIKIITSETINQGGKE